MPKYWGKQIFEHGSFPKVGQKQKTEREKKRGKKKKKKPNDGNNNGQATHGACKPPGPKNLLINANLKKPRLGVVTQAC